MKLLQKMLETIKVSENWKRIASSKQEYQIELLKGMLKKNNIIAISVNKQDSSYLDFGEIDLFVNNKDAKQAQNLILNNERNA